MNINLKQTKTKKSKPKPPIGFGLNKRGKTKKKSNSIFDQDDSSSDEGEHVTGAGAGAGDGTVKSNFNRELAAEQAALRARAKKAMSASTNKGNIYNYDDEYESFSAGHAHASASANIKETDPQDGRVKEKKESRYIQNILQQSKEREMEREIIMERKIAREQQEEDKELGVKGKEKFVTGAYKRKLQERERWIKEDKIKQKKEEVEDVRKKVGGSAIMGFYGNLSRIGGGVGTDSSTSKDGENGVQIDSGERVQSSYGDHGDIMAEDVQPAPGTGTSYPQRRKRSREDDMQNGQIEEVEIEQEMSQQQKRIERMQKVFKARDRYLQRISVKAQ